MPEKILITGGSGLIGRKLTEVLLQNGYEVAWLSRNTGNTGVKTFKWNITDGSIDPAAVEWADHIVHLAGANIFEKKWTKEFKKEIIESRTKTADLLVNAIAASSKKPSTFISASGISYYGVDTKDKLLTEESPAGDGFLAEVVMQWESAADKVAAMNIRVVKLRIGIVLAAEGGALEKMLDAIKKGIGAPLGSGKQYISWIHIKDICRMFVKAIEDKSISGIYNGVGPAPVTNEEMTKALAKKLGKSILMPNVPSFALKMMLGAERASIVLGGNKVSSEKIEKTGFQFQYTNLASALDDLIR
ncbi:MAG TPA: TIGR01777 family oxidoreductase [Cytophagaceae bacterium]